MVHLEISSLDMVLLLQVAHLLSREAIHHPPVVALRVATPTLRATVLQAMALVPSLFPSLGQEAVTVALVLHLIIPVSQVRDMEHQLDNIQTAARLVQGEDRLLLQLLQHILEVQVEGLPARATHRATSLVQDTLLQHHSNHLSKDSPLQAKHQVLQHQAPSLPPTSLHLAALPLLLVALQVSLQHTALRQTKPMHPLLREALVILTLSIRSIMAILHTLSIVSIPNTHSILSIHMADISLTLLHQVKVMVSILAPPLLRCLHLDHKVLRLLKGHLGPMTRVAFLDINLHHSRTYHNEVKY